MYNLDGKIRRGISLWCLSIEQYETCLESAAGERPRQLISGITASLAEWIIDTTAKGIPKSLLEFLDLFLVGRWNLGHLVWKLIRRYINSLSFALSHSPLRM